MTSKFAGELKRQDRIYLQKRNAWINIRDFALDFLY